ncbi:MAG: hypothetical protein OEV80_01165, partial [candidate division Zixibacteria bacterium]|nr:hypothetical protein [candidate division Zixibacteria bacterium]
MRFLQHALLTALFLFTTGTAQVGERRESVEQVQLAGDQSQTPDYGGTDCCNLPIRGNIDCDSYDLIDLIDLVYLIDWMFNGGPGPVCWREANVDGSGHDSLTFETTSEITITDLVYLVEYL